MIKRSGKLEWTEGYKYRTAKTFWIFTGIKPFDEIQIGRITLTVEGQLIIDRGYSWDGPSGPTIDTNNFMVGGVVHDALYEILRCPSKPLDRKCYIERDGIITHVATHDQVRAEADMILKDLILEDGMSNFRANYIYRGVRLGGVDSAEKPRKIHSAPK